MQKHIAFPGPMSVMVNGIVHKDMMKIGKTCLTSCLIMFKCRNTKHICLHLGNVCDGTPDCPLQDDEHLCQLQKVNCPLTCTCLLHAIYCKGFIPKEVSHPEMYLSIIFADTMQMPKYIDIFINATFVKAFNSKLTDICSVTHFKKCLVLNLGNNLIQTVHKKCLDILSQLLSLDLSLNNINIIEKRSFSGLFMLRFVNFSCNPLMALPILFSNITLSVLHIATTGIQHIDIHAFSNVKIRMIVTNDHHICCIAPSNSVCLAHKPWYISCTDILPNLTMKILFKIISISILLLNSTSTMMYILRYKTNKLFSILVIFLNINDIFCSIYLAIIWVGDLTLKDIFSVKEHLWRSGITCQIAFSIALWFTISTQGLLIFFFSF